MAIEAKKLIERNKYLLFSLFVALLLDATFYTGFYGSNDDASYLSAMQHLSRLQMGLACDIAHISLPNGAFAFDAAGLRFSITIPGAIIYKITHGSFAAIMLFILCHHFGLVVIAYKLGEVLHNLAVGIMAAFLTASCPLLFVFAGSLLPDIVLAFWCSLSLYLLMYCHAKCEDIDNNRRLLILFGAGLSLGMGYWSKVSAFYFLPPFIVFVIFWERPFRFWGAVLHLAMLSLGISVILVADIGLVALLFGKLDTSVGLTRVDPNLASLFLNPTEFDPIQRMNRVFDNLLEFFTNETLISFALALLIYPFLKGANRMFYFITIFVFLYHCVGPISVSPYIPSPIQPRYFSIVVMPVIVCFSFLVYFVSSSISGFSTKNMSYFLSMRRCIELIALVVIIVPGILINLDKVGNVYDRNMVNSVLGAYTDYSKKNPGLKIILSERYSYFLNPFFALKQFDGLVLNPLRVWVDRENGRQYEFLIDDRYPVVTPFLFLSYEPKCDQKCLRRLTEMSCARNSSAVSVNRVGSVKNTFNHPFYMNADLWAKIIRLYNRLMPIESYKASVENAKWETYVYLVSCQQ